jgi:ADP-ribose pyrophosphatase YjhB (NUDIX family)
MDKKRYVGVAVKHQNKLLLCKRNNLGSFPGMWSIPGGKLEENETTQEGAKREFFEETALNINDVELTFVGLIPRYTRDGKKVKGFMYVYLLNVETPLYPDLLNAIDGEEHTECGYFTLEEIKPETVVISISDNMNVSVNTQSDTITLTPPATDPTIWPFPKDAPLETEVKKTRTPATGKKTTPAITATKPKPRKKK